MSKMTFMIAPPKFSWDRPIEDELLDWARHMRQSNESYVSTTIWGNKQKREAEIYANAFAMMEKQIKREINIRSAGKDFES